MKFLVRLLWYIFFANIGNLLCYGFNVILDTFWERLILTTAIMLFFELTIFALFRIIFPWGLFNIFED